MPHKHTRTTLQSLPRNYDLPPSSLAKALPVGKVAASNKVTKRRKAAKSGDDTPKAFTRLLQYAKLGKLPYTLDDGDTAGKGVKRKRTGEGGRDGDRRISEQGGKGRDGDHSKTEKEICKMEKGKTKERAIAIPKIMPGERMSDFSARVNQALPISGLSRKGKKGEDGKERQTRLEKKIQRRIVEAKKEDAAWKDRIAEKEDDELAEQEEEEEKWKREQDEKVGGMKKWKGKGPGKKNSSGGGSDDDDPWKQLESKREKPRGVFDVAHAPPELVKVREKFKVMNGARANVMDVPKAAGSLRKREQLGSERQSLIDNYRRLMEERKNAG